VSTSIILRRKSAIRAMCASCRARGIFIDKGSPRLTLIVIPAKAGIQYAAASQFYPLTSVEYWIIRCCG